MIPVNRLTEKSVVPMAPVLPSKAKIVLPATNVLPEIVLIIPVVLPQPAPIPVPMALSPTSAVNLVAAKQPAQPLVMGLLAMAMPARPPVPPTVIV